MSLIKTPTKEKRYSIYRFFYPLFGEEVLWAASIGTKDKKTYIQGRCSYLTTHMCDKIVSCIDLAKAEEIYEFD